MNYCAICKGPADEGGCNTIVGNDGKYKRFGKFICLSCWDDIEDRKISWKEPLEESEYTLPEYEKMIAALKSD